MKHLLFQLFLLSVIPLVVECSHSPLNYEFSKSLHTKYNLYWNNPSNGRICMAVEVDTLGWVGLGFSPNGGMVDSDIMMAWVIDGQVTITDRYAVSQSLPELDEQQDFELVEGYEEGMKTVIQFCRKLQTCDERDRDILSGTTKVVYSWDVNDPNSTPTYHTARGAKNVNFINGRKEFSPDLLANTQTIEFRMGNVTIPYNSDTTYWCRTFHFNQPVTKHHLIKAAVILDSRTTEHLHHMLIYVCNGTFQEVNGDCYDPNSLIITSGISNNCFISIINGWAVGGSDLDFPLNAGVPLGPGEQFDTVLLEIHYNNPNLEAGRIDDSGFLWYYTDTLRTHDIGIMTLGHPVNTAHRVPPNSDNFLVQGYCPNQCTSLWSHDINVVASFLHSHTAGTAIWTQIIRENKEIGYLDMNLNYDFNFQEYLFNEDPITLKPGDQLILNCLYNTKDRDTFTLGGLSTQEEMCLNFMAYYPKIDMPSCVSTYQTSSFDSALDSFQCNNVDVNGSTTYEELYTRAKNIEWTGKIVNTLEVSQLIDPIGQYAACGVSSFPVNIPRPGVDYEVFPNRYDICGKYNGTYYPGGSTADYYYDCATNEPYFDPIGPTDSAPSLTLFPTVWLLAVIIISLI